MIDWESKNSEEYESSQLKRATGSITGQNAQEI
jgi:hypothetical protein